MILKKIKLERKIGWLEKQRILNMILREKLVEA